MNNDIYELRRKRALEYLGSNWLLATPINGAVKPNWPVYLRSGATIPGTVPSAS